jgi:hypothetical protein
MPSNDCSVERRLILGESNQVALLAAEAVDYNRPKAEVKFEVTTVTAKRRATDRCHR